jgi:hypothetical protein
LCVWFFWCNEKNLIFMQFFNSPLWISGNQYWDSHCLPLTLTLFIRKYSQWIYWQVVVGTKKDAFLEDLGSILTHKLNQKSHFLSFYSYLQVYSKAKSKRLHSSNLPLINYSFLGLIKNATNCYLKINKLICFIP